MASDIKTTTFNKGRGFLCLNGFGRNTRWAEYLLIVIEISLLLLLTPARNTENLNGNIRFSQQPIFAKILAEKVVEYWQVLSLENLRRLLG